MTQTHCGCDNCASIEGVEHHSHYPSLCKECSIKVKTCQIKLDTSYSGDYYYIREIQEDKCDRCKRYTPSEQLDGRDLGDYEGVNYLCKACVDMQKFSDDENGKRFRGLTHNNTITTFTWEPSGGREEYHIVDGGGFDIMFGRHLSKPCKCFEILRV
jgi:hypothetical protein